MRRFAFSEWLRQGSMAPLFFLVYAIVINAVVVSAQVSDRLNVPARAQDEFCLAAIPIFMPIVLPRRNFPDVIVDGVTTDIEPPVSLLNVFEFLDCFRATPIVVNQMRTKRLPLWNVGWGRNKSIPEGENSVWFADFAVHRKTQINRYAVSCVFPDRRDVTNVYSTVVDASKSEFLNRDKWAVGDNHRLFKFGVSIMQDKTLVANSDSSQYDETKRQTFTPITSAILAALLFSVGGLLLRIGVYKS